MSYRAVHEDIDLTGVRPELAALIRRCVAKDPADRPELSAVIAGCAVDSALATDTHYRSVAHSADPVPVSASVPGKLSTPSSSFTTQVLSEPEPGTEATTRQRDREPVDQVAQGGGAPVRPESPGTTPYDRPDLHQAPAPGPRRRAWLAACAVVVAATVAVWLLPETDSKSQGEAPSTGVTGSGARTASGPTAGAPAGRPPDHILNDRVSQDRWVLSDDPEQAAQGIGFCELAGLAESSPPMDLQSSVSHTTGTDTASLELRPKDTGQGKRPAPYYVSVGVRPPHETDRGTGRPMRSVGKGIGFTSKPFDIYSRWSSGGTVRLRYPDDFRAHFEGGVVDAIPVGDDRGDWTVVLYHVEGGPKEYTSVVCNGFHA
ncbi:hypothetical protein ACIOJD_25740 [Streptomyces sp. NPDC088116]|uniref:hypothetical protein n=1 Tax=Streptomyces sp. NPDC088116 TaxID=3365825 RepID=UPI00380FA15D